MLCVESKTSAYWLLRYQRNKIVKHMGLGSAHDVSLAAVRVRARRERERLADGIDPLELKRKDREAKRQAEAKRLTFKDAAVRCHAALEKGWTSSHHSDEFINSLQRYVYPHIGNLDVSAVGKDEVLRVLEQKLPSRIKGTDGGVFWHTKTITADRVRARVQTVLDWAEARGFRPAGTPNPARWAGFLDVLLQKPRKIAPVKHMAAVPFAEVPAVMAALATNQNVAAQCLRFIILTACRLGEALRATWTEVDLEAAEWTIPASRMKARREHRVPLSPQAVELLRSLYREDGNPYLFISTRTAGAHVVESTVGIALRDAGRRETIHGFRASFKTWAEERTNFPGIIVELSLAHRVGNAVENAYRRSDLTTKRAKLMQAWGKYITSPPSMYGMNMASNERMPHSTAVTCALNQSLKQQPWSASRRSPKHDYEQDALRQGHIAVNSILKELRPTTGRCA
jgi:integrase